jgi:hypothetical protein
MANSTVSVKASAAIATRHTFTSGPGRDIS